jgi:CheY-like chemotaxis protein
MQEPLRVVFVEQRHADHTITAQLLRDCHLDFSWQCVELPRELSQVAADFNPHIVLCTGDMPMNSGRGLLEALRLLCSQTPIIKQAQVTLRKTWETGSARFQPRQVLQLGGPMHIESGTSTDDSVAETG